MFFVPPQRSGGSGVSCRWTGPRRRVGSPGVLGRLPGRSGHIDDKHLPGGFRLRFSLPPPTRRAAGIALFSLRAISAAHFLGSPGGSFACFRFLSQTGWGQLRWTLRRAGTYTPVEEVGDRSGRALTRGLHSLPRVAPRETRRVSQEVRLAATDGERDERVNPFPALFRPSRTKTPKSVKIRPMYDLRRHAGDSH